MLHITSFEALLICTKNKNNSLKKTQTKYNNNDIDNKINNQNDDDDVLNDLACVNHWDSL